MSEPLYETKAVGRMFMHEYAEVLGISTDMILAVTAMPEGGGILVLYTPGGGDDWDIHGAVVARDRHGILTWMREVMVPRDLLKNAQAEILARLAELDPEE